MTIFFFKYSNSICDPVINVANSSMISSLQHLWNNLLSSGTVTCYAHVHNTSQEMLAKDLY